MLGSFVWVSVRFLDGPVVSSRRPGRFDPLEVALKFYGVERHALNAQGTCHGCCLGLGQIVSLVW